MDNPSYEQVKTGTSGHLEVVEIEFDPALFPYSQLLEIFWQQIDPTDDEGQFQDRGDQYRTAIFYYTDEQREQAELEKTKLQDSQKFAKPIVTRILPATTFYPAEEYHQDFYKKILNTTSKTLHNQAVLNSSKRTGSDFLQIHGIMK